MTLENFNYRTNPLFLRNEFESSNKYGIPDIPIADFSFDDLEELRLLAFNQSKSDNGIHSNRIVHFFLYDYNFESVWKEPEKFTELFSKYKGILTPDYSMYIEMPYAVQLYNVFRNRWCGAYYASKGIKVIPTVAWSDRGSFDFCFKGISKGSIVAVSTYMFHESANHESQKELFMEGYNRMLEEIEPSAIICYSEPFPEMKGNIIYIDYELSSWKYLSDDKSFRSIVNNGETQYLIVKNYGYVCKGGGSAYGGAWKPKSENSKRFLGKPDTIRQNTVTTTKGSYEVLNKYDSKGRAIAERHLTDHRKPNRHTDPHDHTVDWSNNYPDPQSPISYFNKEVPTFEEFIREIFDEIVEEIQGEEIQGENIQGEEKSMKN
ncbi:MAG: DUF4417 domain-containing protein, partial [Ruminococcus sp.]|nr:DUF4417 domain-containing protein [Ruminococcus sp.]